MQSNSDIMLELMELLKKYMPKDVPHNICAKCKKFNFEGKSLVEYMNHIDNCELDPKASYVVTIPPIESSHIDSPKKVEEKFDEALASSLSPVKIEDPHIEPVLSSMRASQFGKIIEYHKW